LISLILERSLALAVFLLYLLRGTGLGFLFEDLLLQTVVTTSSSSSSSRFTAVLGLKE
jgi:hypothetical protein